MRECFAPAPVLYRKLVIPWYLLAMRDLDEGRRYRHPSVVKWSRSHGAVSIGAKRTPPIT
jgi:hypothetical protein